MLLHLMLTGSLVAQGPTAPAPRSVSHPTSPPVRVWLPDTLPHVGQIARVYVRLASTGHLMVLHVDARGNIRVLFPEAPTDEDAVPGGRAFEVVGPRSSGAFLVTAPGPGLVLAIRSTDAFDLAGLEVSGAWDYDHALLLQPTAGSQFAAMLDIADRVTDGRAYQYDQVGYRTPGSAVERVASGEAVCLQCFTAHAGSHDTPAPTTEVTTVVDCSNTTLVDSFCGVQDNRSYVTESYVAAPPSAPTEAVSGYPVVVPVYYPLFIPNGRYGERRPSRQTGLRLESRLHALPDRVAPPPPRRRPTIVVRQPRAPSRPRAATADDGMTPAVIPPSDAPSHARFVRRAPSPALPPENAQATPTTAASVWTAVPFGGVAPQRAWAEPRGIAPAAAASFALPAGMRGTLVPSRAFVHALAGRPR